VVSDADVAEAARGLPVAQGGELCLHVHEVLCTCIRSSRCARSRRRDSSIWRTPACFPVVHTLVATKSFEPTCSSVASWPVTDSAEPYMGEVSMTRPPSATKTRRVSFASAMPRPSPPTSKACQVPKPTAGRGSDVLGMRRSSTVLALDRSGMSNPPRPTADIVRNARRLLSSCIIASIVPERFRQVKPRHPHPGPLLTEELDSLAPKRGRG